MPELPSYSIRVSMQMTNPPKPVGFGVLDQDGCPVAFLTIEQVREALDRAVALLIEGKK